MKGLAFDKITNEIHVENKSDSVQKEPIQKITVSSRLGEYKKQMCPYVIIRGIQ